MEGTLVLPDVKSNIATVNDQQAFADIAKSSDYLPRLQLTTGNSQLSLEGKAVNGDWVVVITKQAFKNLGKTVSAWVIAWRPKALQIGGDSPVAFYDVNSPEFKSVRSKADVKDSGCMFGPEFLLYIPEAGYVTFHMASKTARNVAPTVHAIYGAKKPLVLTSALIKTPKYSWHGPQATEGTVQIEFPPDTEKLTDIMTKFLNPKASEVEVAETAGDASRPQ